MAAGLAGRFAALALAAVLAGCAGLPDAASQRSDELFARVGLGMGRDEVQRLLGPPDETMPFSLSGTVAWDYRYTDTWGYFAVFSVTFDAAWRVVSKLAWRTNDGGDFQ